MARPLRTWVVSATAAAGVIGAGVAVAATGNGPSAPASPAPHTVADPAAAADVAQLRARVAELLAQEQRLRNKTDRARRHLNAQIAAGRAAAARSAAVAAVPAAAPVRTTVVPARPAPAPVATHTTSGASGAHRGGQGESEHEGHDD